MPDNDRQGLLLQPLLTADQRDEIATLSAICNAHEGLDLKLSIGMSRPEVDQPADDFLFYADDRLVGYCALDDSGGSLVELCGMVHPEYRRRGIGRALLQAAIAESRCRGITRLLLICEDASISGMGFVSATGSIYRFSEYRLELDAVPMGRHPFVLEQLTLREAGRQDLELLVQILAASFDDAEEEVLARVSRNLADPSEHYYLAHLGETPVGSIRTSIEGNDASIYSFGVLPAYRGRGFGREILSSTVEKLLATHHGRISLEVETDNRNALGLYVSCGFREVTTYGYYQLQLT